MKNYKGEFGIITTLFNKNITKQSNYTQNMLLKSGIENIYIGNDNNNYVNNIDNILDNILKKNIDYEKLFSLILDIYKNYLNKEYFSYDINKNIPNIISDDLNINFSKNYVKINNKELSKIKYNYIKLIFNNEVVNNDFETFMNRYVFHLINNLSLQNNDCVFVNNHDYNNYKKSNI